MKVSNYKRAVSQGLFILILGVFICSCTSTTCKPIELLEEDIQIESSDLLDESLHLTTQKPLTTKEEENEKKLAEALEPKSAPIPIKRTVIALWDSKYETDIQFTTAHRYIEMPLNFYGIKVEYVDLQKSLPHIRDREDVIGILSWLPELYSLRLPNVLIRWLIDAIDADKKLVLIGTLQAIDPDEPIELMSELWERLGIYTSDFWISLTYDCKVSYQDPELFPFEGDFPEPLPDFVRFTLADPNAKVHLKVKRTNHNQEYPIIITNSKGAFAPEDYLIYRAFYHNEVYKKWLINPFRFLKQAYNLPEIPVPDPSTVAGRRAYFSHIDGDGWNNETEIIDTRGKEGILSSEIVLKQVVEAFPDLPVTVGPIAANLNLEWNGLPKSQELARKFFVLPQVETGCHTYTHPFDWGFFENYSPKKEEPFLDRYESKTWQASPINAFRRLFHKQETFYKMEETAVKSEKEEELTESKISGEQPDQHYFTPRAYALKPFDLTFEIKDAIEEINFFAPPQKQVCVYQWSGNTLPWKEAIALTRKAQVANINGGDPRFDFLHPSYSYVCSLARRLGNEIQVYTCSSNENLYTDLWTEHFYGLVTLPTTWKMTETPIRVKALNLYYHMYSGEKLPSLHALLLNLAYVRTQKVTPIPTSLYCKWVDGFFSTRILKANENEWYIQNRGALQNFRIDDATFLGVDFHKSQGVVGQRHFQGCLYVYLDEQVDIPFIAIQDIEISDQEPLAIQPYLIESRWRVWNLVDKGEGNFSFITQGFGVGDMRWKVPHNGTYEARLFSEDGSTNETYKIKSINYELQWIFTQSALQPCRVKVRMRDVDTVISVEESSILLNLLIKGVQILHASQPLIAKPFSLKVHNPIPKESAPKIEPSIATFNLLLEITSPQINLKRPFILPPFALYNQIQSEFAEINEELQTSVYKLVDLLRPSEIEPSIATFNSLLEITAQQLNLRGFLILPPFAEQHQLQREFNEAKKELQTSLYKLIDLLNRPESSELKKDKSFNFQDVALLHFMEIIIKHAAKRSTPAHLPDRIAYPPLLINTDRELVELDVQGLIDAE